MENLHEKYSRSNCIGEMEDGAPEKISQHGRGVEEGIKRTDCPYVVIENRREAIREALTIARENDVIVLAGKGHETYQEICGVKHPFDERIVVAELLAQIRGE